MGVISRILFVDAAAKAAGRDAYSASSIRVDGDVVFNIVDNAYAVAVVGGLLYSTI